MRKRLLIIIVLLTTLTTCLWGQSHSIKGIVIDKASREFIPYANVSVSGTPSGAVTDSVGVFFINSLAPGTYTLQVSYVGYKTAITSEYILSAKDLYITVEMEESSEQLSGITVYPSLFRRSVESPVSMHVIGISEIEKSPGANRDISRIVQSYPGVSFSPSGYRNDLVVRGGGPGENRFFLEGVEIPTINHFSTQGASGGPVGIINADLIREVSFYTGAFPGFSNDALSSVLNFSLREGSPEKYSLKATLGASEVSLASNGPIGKKTTYIASVRRSYLQFLFDILGLPFLPTYNDAQFKIKTKLSTNHELLFLGLGGLDNMKLNKKADSEDAEYILGYLPQIKQEMFTLGAVYKHYGRKNAQTIVLSHSYLNNRNIKYQNNEDRNPDKLMLHYKSLEQETKFRIENFTRLQNIKINTGINLDYTQYENNTFQRIFLNNSTILSDYATNLFFFQWGFFGTVDYSSSNERFSGSFGFRMDAASYSSLTRDVKKQFSPRLSLSYRIANDLRISASTGRYFQLPPLTALGFKDNNGVYVNKKLGYMKSDQFSAGLNYKIKNNLELSLEGFYKKYVRMPLSENDGIPLMSKGDDYGVIGNELLNSSAEGKAYGIELLARWIILKRLNLSSSFTLFKSQYKNSSGEYIPSAWDDQYIFNLTTTYYLPANWSVGVKIRSIGKGPYTPYDQEKSSLVTAWDVQGRPYLDYSRFNSMRNSSYTQPDLRVDKLFYLKKYMLGFYIDIQNITGSKFKRQDAIISTGKIINPEDPVEMQRYEMKSINRSSSSRIPTIGATFEF